MKKSLFIFLSALLLTFTACFTSCDSWMSDDDFYGEIENDVKVANAAAVSVYVRYANSKMGSTEPSGFTTLKVDVPSTLTAVTNDDYGFVRWVAFSTSDFPTNLQHSNLYYESEERYAEDFLPLELPASEVFFSEPTKTSTKVTLYTTRSDIFIMPLVTKRPTVVTSVPSNGRTDVVKNSQIRILFSKPIDESTLQDEFGNSNIQVTSGRAVLTESSDDLSALDITNNFDFRLSRTKKMLTISAKKDASGKAIYKFDNNSQISVTLFEDLKDTDGYAMNGSYKFSFTTGTKEDSLAPKIENLTAGIGQKCLDYQQYKYDSTVVANDPNTKYSILAQNAPDSLSAYVTESNRLKDARKVPLLTQRVKDKLNIFVRATDIAGAGAAVTLDDNTQSENDVAIIQIRASRYADIDGSPVTTSETAFANGSIGTDTTDILYIREYGYVLGMKDSDCQVRGAFETVTATEPDTNNPGTLRPNTSGTLFTYDLSTLADGLIKIDLWAVDMVGNSGDTEAYAGTYDNGYRSIFVVKDSTPPDAATEKTKIEAQENTAAPYKWFNYNSLSTMQIADKATDLIQDANHEYLSSDINKLKWIFKVGNDPNWAPSPTDSAWTAIHTASNQPIIKTLTEAAASTDGPVDITMCLKDDLDNVSAPVLLNSIMYDNTAPVLSTPGWVKKTSTTSYTYEDLVATTSESNLATSGHVLKIPFTEEWAGLRRIKLTVQKDGTGDAVVQDNYSIAYVPASGTGRALTYTAGSDSTLKILSVDDDTAVKTGNLYISGIKIGNENGGSYRVTVDLWDSSLNHSVTYSDISIDTTAPELKKVYIPGLKQSINATSSGFEVTSDDGWILPREYVKGPEGQSSNSSTSPAYIPLYLFVKEADSGIHKISFASTDDVKLFNDTSKKTTLYKIENFGQTNEVRTLVPESDYTIDTSAKTITLVDNPTVKLSSSNENGFVILVKDIGFNTYKPGENKIDLTVTDLATLSANNNKLSPYTSGSTEITGVKADSYLSSSPTYTLKDRGVSGESLAAESGYTNEAIIDVDISVGTDAGSSAISGYNSFKLSGAKFIPDQTQVLIGSTSITYQLSENNTVLTLRQKEGTDFAETDKYIVLRNKTFTIKNIQLDDSTSDGVKSLSITTYDLAGWNHTATTKTITLDTTPPELLKVPFTAVYTNSTTGYDSAKTVYPHADGENASGSMINGLATFYTSKPTDSGQSNGVLLGIRATDNIALSGNTGNTPFLRIVSGNNMSKADILSSVSTYNLSVKNSDSGNTVKNSRFDIRFTAGAAYGGVIVDKAGNCSDVFKFKVQEDITPPVMKDSANKSLNEYVYMEAPDAGSGIYKNEIDSFSDRNEFIYAIDSSSTDPIRTKKYVTKKSSGKYKIIFNLAAEKYVATNEVTRLINGTEPASGANYAELAPTATSAPIEEYAIRTWYSSYPKASYHNLSYETAIPAADSSYWHKFENRTGNFKNDDSVNGIMSYVEDNNLIIELPQRNTSPVSVVLKDACGNLNSIVLGLHDDGTANHDMIAPSFILDDHLGYAATDANGEVVTPIVIQNPYMTSGAAESDDGTVWGNEGRYKWNNQSGNTDGDLTSQNGEHEHFGFFKDAVKKATYYNPDLFSPQTFKIGFTLRFGSTFQSSTNPESVTFAAKQKAPDADVAVGKYTARALLYCTQSSTKPSKQDILDCYNSEFGSGGERTGRITDWTYVQAGNLESEVTMLLDYPKPDYTKLTGWTLKNSNGEPEPYYIWYLYEDRIGNYEIAKLVNSGALGNDLKGTKAGMYDRWFYDGDGPKITIRSTGADPKELNATQAAVDTLVAKNNGYVPYLKPSSNIVYVRSGSGEELRDSSLENTNLGWGTTHHVENAGGTQYYRIYEPFMDLEVSERTGIRAFAWSTTGTAPDYTYSTGDSFWDGNTQGDAGYWYPGYKATALYADIGCNHTYTGDTTNPYFSFTDSSSSYKGVYSGTKINTVIPSTLLSTSEAKPLYLHVMDWTGNITTVRMGQNLTFIKDTTHPNQQFRESSGIDKTRSVDGEYYVNSEKYTPQNKINIHVRIAGLGNKATNHEPIIVRFPSEFFSDTGSGNKGFGTSKTDITTVNSDAEGPYLKFDYDTYKDWPSTGTPVKFYYYDNVGNQDWWDLICCFDTEAPVLRTISFVTEAGKNTEFLHEDTATDPINEVSGFGKVTNYHKRTATKHDDISHFGADEVQKIYVNKEGTSRFHVNFNAAIPDLADIKVNKWNETSSEWETVTSWKTNSSEWESSADGDGVLRYYTMVPYNKLTYSAEGTYYQIIATDKSSNAAYQYFKIYLDNQAPAFTPVVTVSKGSVNKIPAASGAAATAPVEYAYYSDAGNPMKITFTATDAGVGTINKTYEYSLNNGTSWTEFDGSAAKELSFTTETSVQGILLRDKLGNKTSTAPTFTYSTATDIGKLINYAGKTVTAPTMTDIGDLQTKGGYGYSQYNVEKITDASNNLIVIKKDDRTGVKFTITPPSTDTTILGYIDSAYVDTTGAYSLVNLEAENSPVKKTFEYTLPMTATHLTIDEPKTYYAVNYAGMVSSTGLTVKFTYNNPKAAQNVEFVPADSTIISSDAELQTNLTGKTLTSTFKSGNNLYYKDGWVLLRCTLYSANDDSENPKTLKLWYQDGNSWTQCGEFKTSDNSLVRYNSSLQDGTRYYCYLLFQLGENQHNKNLYCTIESNNSETRKLPLFSSTETGITWVRDNAGPAVSTDHYKTENQQGQGVYYPAKTEKIKRLYNYTAQVVDADGHVTTINADLPTVHDSQIGKGYDSIKYKHGTQIIIPKSWISESSGLKKYIFKQVVETTDHPGDESFTKDFGASTWTDIPDGDNLILSLPDITTPHTHLALFLQDALGNYDVYYIGNKVSSYQQWWILDKAITASDITTTATPTAWAAGTSEYSVTVNIPEGMIVYSIDAENANVKEFKFYDYVPRINNTSHTQEQPSSTELYKGWINVDYLTLKLDGITPGWSAKDVKVVINGVAQAGKVFEVPAKTIAAGDITLGQATATETTGTYTISLTCDEGAKSQIASVTATGLGTGGEATLNEDKTVITLTGVPAADWVSDKTVTLKITTDKNVDLDMGTVLTVGKKTLSSENFSTNITVGTLATETNTCAVTFNDEGIPATIINASGHKLLSNGTEVSGASVTYSSTDKKFTISGIPAANFTGSLTIKLQVSTRDGSFDGGIIHNVAAKTAADLSDLTITGLNPATWNNNLSWASFTIKAKTAGLSITSVSVSPTAGSLQDQNNGNYGLSPISNAKIPEDIEITIATNHGNVTWKPWGTNNSSIGTTGFTVGGITAFGGGAGSGDTGGSRITQFFNNVANVFVADSTAEKPVAQNKQAEKEAKALAKAAKKATKKAKKSKKSQAATSPVVELPQSDSINTTVTTDTMMPVIEWEQSDRIEITSVTEEAEAEMSLSGSPVVEWEQSDRIETTVESETTQHSSTSAILVVMLAVLSSAGGAWYTLKRRKK